MKCIVHYFIVMSSFLDKTKPVQEGLPNSYIRTRIHLHSVQLELDCGFRCGDVAEPSPFPADMLSLFSFS